MLVGLVQGLKLFYEHFSKIPVRKIFAEPWPLKKWIGTVALTVKLTYTERPQSDVKQAVGVKSLNAQALNTTSPKSPTD